MTASIRKTTVAALAAAALALGASPAAGAQEYVPFVTDFPTSGATTEYIPFVTDFGIDPRPAGEPVVINPRIGEPPLAAPAARSWADMALGSAIGLGLALLLVGGALAVRRLRAHDAVGAEAR